MDDPAAAEMVASIDRAQESLALLDRADPGTDWQGTLGNWSSARRSTASCAVAPPVMLLEEGAIDGGEVQRLPACSSRPPRRPRHRRRFRGGRVRGSALLLAAGRLRSALDARLRDLSPDAFTEALPLVRRAFADFQPPRTPFGWATRSSASAVGAAATRCR
ncbi:MAG: DUF5682 family protein [Chloroflexia bacterium]